MSSSNTIRLGDIISSEVFSDLNPELSKLKVSGRIPPTVCLACRGGRMMCGKTQCPLIAKAQSMVRLSKMIDSDHLAGSTPPGVFVGRAGYPKVYAGPLLPPFYGDTEILDTPEWWMGKSIRDIIDYRFSLIRGKTRMDIKLPSIGNSYLDVLQELAMGVKSSNSEAVFERKPSGGPILSEESQPFGPSAPIKFFKSSNISIDKRIEKAYFDRNLNAADAAIELYQKGVYVTRIQRAFSVGMFGLGSLRKLVPTRWSITAVDTILSNHLINELKQNPTIDQYRVYFLENLGNKYIAILLPESWRFEWIEAWFPGTPWNPHRENWGTAMIGDYEPYWGRTTYPGVGGCYFSTRLAVAENLVKEHKQASALVLREIHPEYILPLGVWNVREGIRATLSTKPSCFDTFDSAVHYAMNRLTISFKNWIANSALLREILTQRKLTDYV